MKQRQEREQDMRGENKMPIVELSKSDKKRKLLRLAFESVTVVWLSSYRPPSVNAVSAISHKKVSVCVCVCARCQETVIRVTLSRCDSFSHLLSLSLSLILSVRSRSLPPPP